MEYEIEIQTGDAARVLYVKARSAAQAILIARGRATRLETQWGRFVVTGR